MPRGTINLAGELSLAQSACPIAGARVFVGPDTVTTHVAAALGVPTVAIYGPSNPVKWCPWPPGRFPGEASPWRRMGGQSTGNVELVQGVGACVPCMREGCDRHVASASDCLLQLPLAAVTAAIERALTRSAPTLQEEHESRQSGLPHPGRPASANRQALATAGHTRSTVWLSPLKSSSCP